MKRKKQLMVPIPKNVYDSIYNKGYNAGKRRALAGLGNRTKPLFTPGSILESPFK